ncbi:MAG: cytochrome C [bacterium]|nr:cytochrome C [bacterium]
MGSKSVTRSEFMHRMLNFANNPTTIIGFTLTTISGLLLLIFVLVEFAGHGHNPYTSAFAFLILPALFIFGLMVMPVGMLRLRRRLLAEGTSAEELDRFPRLDFNDPNLRRVATVIIILTTVNVVILGTASVLGIEYMESVPFCGEVCHTVMQPEFVAYQESPHSRVACVECHIGPGAPWFVRSKIDGLRQVWHTALGSYSRPIHSPIVDLRPARETCEQCHWPTKHHGDKLRVFARHRSDENNSPSYTAMLLKTGGGRMDLGQHGGIHWWHIEADNKIRYVAGDDRRESIIWVELTTPEGEILTYTREWEEIPAPQELERQARTMDCIDCHNRPTHLFKSPAKALDDELQNRPDLRELPFFKKQALVAIQENGAATRELGMSHVETVMKAFYQQNYADLFSTQSELVDLGAELAKEIYGETHFPQMNTTWETHPTHIGHEESPGCWRCHDDEMTTSDGSRTIPLDCENCHVMIVEDEPELPDLGGALGG